MSALKSSEHVVKRLVFTLLRLFLRKGRKNLNLDPTRIKRVLFLRPEKIGDMVISLPTFEALHRAFPHIKIGLLASPGNQALVQNDPRLDKVFLYRKNLSDFRELARIRRERFDCVIDMIDGDSATTLFYSQLIGGGAIRIGIGKERHGKFYDFNHGHDDGIGGHIIDNTLQLLSPLGIDASCVSRYVPPHVPESISAPVDSFVDLASNHLQPVVGLNLSAGKPNRIWPKETAVEFGRALLEKHQSLRLIIIVTPSDRARGSELLQTLSSDRVSLVPDRLSLLGVSSLISNLQLLISPDTSLIHIARSYRVPVVGLYNRAGKNFTRWRPYGQNDGAVVSDHIDNLRDIAAEAVLEAVSRQLQMIQEAPQ